MSTPHINAEKGAFAKVVLMPGDPLRAKWIADNFLSDVKEVCSIRGMVGYTGRSKNGKTISVMPSGMGMPSIGIYCHELFTEYGVEAIIRVGTAGALQPYINCRDILIGQAACTNSNWMGQYDLYGGTYSAIASYSLLEAAVDAAKKRSGAYYVGNILSSDTFYDADPSVWKKWQSLGVLGTEMEAYALYVEAMKLGKKALAICTVSDLIYGTTQITPEERQKGLVNMIEIAIDAASPFAD